MFKTINIQGEEKINEGKNGMFYYSDGTDTPDLEEFVSWNSWKLTDNEVALIEDTTDVFTNKSSKLLDYAISKNAKTFSTINRTFTPARSFSYSRYEEELELAFCYSAEKNINKDQLSFWLMVRNGSAYIVPFFTKKGAPVSYEEYSPSVKIEENLKEITKILAKYNINISKLPKQIKKPSKRMIKKRR